MKKLFLLASALLLAACAPSRVQPSVTTNSVTAFGFTKVLSRTLNVPTQPPHSFKFDGSWEIGTTYFSLEKNLAFFTCVKDEERVQFRTMKKIDLFRDSTFKAEKDADEEAFILYYLKWDHDFWVAKQEALSLGTATGPIFNSEKRYGTIKTVNGAYQRCVLAGIEGDAIYMMTGEAVGSDRDICETQAKIWNSREPY